MKDISVRANGRTYSGLGTSIWSQFRTDMGISETDCPSIRTGWPLPDSVMKVGEEVPLFTTPDSASMRCIAQMFRLLAGNDIVIEVRYASLYGDEFASVNSARLNDPIAMRLAEQLNR